ncbi:MAG: hypothetical protein OJF50_001887 [Nitrospira sp.]|nr:hypothetical protein [Nitrospira sp.]
MIHKAVRQIIQHHEHRQGTTNRCRRGAGGLRRPIFTWPRRRRLEVREHHFYFPIRAKTKAGLISNALLPTPFFTTRLRSHRSMEFSLYWFGPVGTSFVGESRRTMHRYHPSEWNG